MKRRQLVVGAGAAAGLAAGVAVSLRHPKQSDEPADVPGTKDIWSLTFSRVDGAPVAMSGLRGRPLLVNFWATWCAPCATEMPLLDTFARTASSRGWNVIALAVDSADPVRRFVAERALSLPIALAGADGLDLSRSLGNSVGALPFTVVFNADGSIAQRKLGALDARLLESWAAPSR